MFENFEKIEFILYKEVSESERLQYRHCKEYPNILKVLTEYKSKYLENQDYILFHNSKIKEEKDQVDKMLLWLYENVKANSHYSLFILYDHLITLKWLYQVEEK